VYRRPGYRPRCKVILIQETDLPFYGKMIQSHNECNLLHSVASWFMLVFSLSLLITYLPKVEQLFNKEVYSLSAVCIIRLLLVSNFQRLKFIKIDSLPTGRCILEITFLTDGIIMPLLVFY
jgi:hypothetical protein